jgi:hypothetical protein
MLTRPEVLSQLAEFSLLAFSELGDQPIRAVKTAKLQLEQFA